VLSPSSLQRKTKNEMKKTTTIAIVFFFSSRRKEKKNTKKKKTIEKEKKENVERGGRLPFFSRFRDWDEMLLLPSPLHIPSTLSSPPSSSLVSCVSLKL
jgi:hypothetical protein